MYQRRPRRLQGLAWQPAQSSQDQGRYPGRLRRTPSSHSVLPTVSDHCTPAIQGETTTSTPLPLMYAAPPCDYKRRRRAPFRLAGLSGFSLPRGRSGTTEHSSQPTPLLAETWGLLSLSRLACTPYYKHSGCKIIQCPRTLPLLDVRPRGRNQDKPCVTVLPLASSSGTRKHAAFTSWDPGPRVGTPTASMLLRSDLFKSYRIHLSFDLWRIAVFSSRFIHNLPGLAICLIDYQFFCCSVRS